MPDSCWYPELAKQAEAHGVIALARLYASVSWPEEPFLWDVVDEADCFFYDGLDPKQPPDYWLLNGEEAVLGELRQFRGLSEHEFRDEFPKVELQPGMRAVGVVRLADSRLQFIVFDGELSELVEACGYGR